MEMSPWRQTNEQVKIRLLSELTKDCWLSHHFQNHFARTISRTKGDLMPELTKTFFEKILRDSERQDIQVDLDISWKFLLAVASFAKESAFLQKCKLLLFLSSFHALACSTPKGLFPPKLSLRSVWVETSTFSMFLKQRPPTTKRKLAQLFASF